ncbi:hypothetical protein V6N13_019751 [Hibiscus sabdariffa]
MSFSSPGPPLYSHSFSWGDLSMNREALGTTEPVNDNNLNRSSGYTPSFSRQSGMLADDKAFTERGAYRYLRMVSPSLPAGGEETGKTLAGNHKWHRDP